MSDGIFQGLVNSLFVESWANLLTLQILSLYPLELYRLWLLLAYIKNNVITCSEPLETVATISLHKTNNVITCSGTLDCGYYLCTME